MQDYIVLVEIIVEAEDENDAMERVQDALDHELVWAGTIDDYEVKTITGEMKNA